MVAFDDRLRIAVQHQYAEGRRGFILRPPCLAHWPFAVPGFIDGTTAQGAISTSVFLHPVLGIQGGSIELFGRFFPHVDNAYAPQFFTGESPLRADGKVNKVVPKIEKALAIWAAGPVFMEDKIS
jgi:hypothetical protein